THQPPCPVDKTYAQAIALPPTHPTTQLHTATRPSKRDNHTQMSPKKTNNKRSNHNYHSARMQRKNSMRNDRGNGRTTHVNNRSNVRPAQTNDRSNENVPPLLDSHEVRDRAAHDPQPPALSPVRQWDNNMYHQVPVVPPPPAATHAGSQSVAVHVSGTRPKVFDSQQSNRQYRTYQQDENDDNNFQEVVSRRDNKLRKLQARGTQRGLRGAPEPDVVYLYITSCDINTTSEEVELHILENYENVSEVRARSTMRSHNYYASFTVTIKGDDLDTDDFLLSDVFESPIKVFLNRNKYSEEERV
ncbi:MAG: hypothetical protein AAGJ80_17845, partial [Cyanobacteria bacterium J06553_1]